jgi:regulatory protein
VLRRWRPTTATNDPWTALIRFLRSGPHTEYEAKVRLKTKGFGPAEIEEAVRRAVDAGLLDDRLFAKLWVEDRVHRRALSRRALEAELSDRGINSTLANEALAVGYPPELECDVAREAAEKRWSRDRTPDLQRRRQRVAAYLIRRGFSTGAAFAAVRQAEKESGDDD